MEQVVLLFDEGTAEAGMGARVKIVHGFEAAHPDARPLQLPQQGARHRRSIEDKCLCGIFALQRRRHFGRKPVIETQMRKPLRNGPARDKIPHRLQMPAPCRRKERIHDSRKLSRVRLGQMERQEKPRQAQIRCLFQPCQALTEFHPQTGIE